MPSYNSYIASTDATGFYWDDIPDKVFRTGNSPPRLCPKDWWNGLPFSYRWIKNKIDTGEATGKQIDWGGWAIVLIKIQIINYMVDIQQKSRFGDYEALINELNQTLDNNHDYLLVVLENP